MTWMRIEMSLEGYFDIPVGEREDPQAVAQDMMENGHFENGSKWLDQLYKNGMVGLKISLADEAVAKGFVATVEHIKKPHDPKDFAPAKRPERRRDD